MTKKKKSTAQKKARLLQAETGMPYTAALAQVRAEAEGGRVECADCGAMVTTENLASLPPHGCLQRQATPAGGSDA